ncbi:MAG: hypothetical protein J0H67_17315 [Rhodospirillales bacterium]|nr:hypothetical protein [Rhodospirillales bacterium]
MTPHRIAAPLHLRRDIVGVLLLKLVALTLLWLFCFSPAHRPAIDPAGLFASPASPPTTR